MSSDKQPLDPCHPARARKLLDAGRAAVLRRYPFTIILKDRLASDSETHEHTLKIDPGSKTTGIAVVQAETGKVVFACEIAHRGQTVHMALDSRRAIRRSRRQRHCRYRQPRFNNRNRRPGGWLPPSLESRIANVETWARRIMRYLPVTGIAYELVRFDTQLMQNPDIGGVAYQQGELAGYEVREYLLEKWQRKCAYCGKTGVPLQVEHLIPRARGGSSRVSNLTLACGECNMRKGTKTAAEFGHPDLMAQARKPLRDAAAVNTTRWSLFYRLRGFGLPVECGSGGLTKFNRTQHGLPKAHWLDAACVGHSTPITLLTVGVSVLQARAMGHGSRQMCRVNKYGFPRSKAKSARYVHGFRTGDMVRAVVPSGKKVGRYSGRVAVRSSGSFDIRIQDAVVQSISWRHCVVIQRGDGFAYSTPHSPI